MTKNEIVSFFYRLKQLPDLDESIHISSFLLFLLGGKKVTLEYINYEFLSSTKSFFDSYSTLFSYKIIPLDEREFIVFFCKKNQLLEEFSKKFEEYISGDNSHIVYIGKLLGFPDCCIKSFYNFFKEYKFNQIGENTYDYISFISYCNKLKSKKLDIFSNRVITHTPCSFSCKKSLELFHKVQKMLLFYGLSNTLEEKGNIYLLFQCNSYICLNLDGTFRGNGVYYEKNTVSDKYFNDILSIIKKGDKLKYNKLEDVLYLKLI